MSKGYQIHESGIEGLGVFATRSFRPGERILRFVHDDVLGPDRPLAPGELPDHVDQLAGGVEVYLPAPGRHVNSCCDPTARVRWDGDECWCVAYKAIEPGDEITVDYAIATHNEQPLPCTCGAARCRGEIPGSVFDLGEDWLREYEPLMADWFIAENETEYRAMCERLGIEPRVGASR